MVQRLRRRVVIFVMILALGIGMQMPIMPMTMASPGAGSGTCKGCMPGKMTVIDCGALCAAIVSVIDVRGISLAGMPEGSPGMGRDKAASFVIREISNGATKIYGTE